MKKYLILVTGMPTCGKSTFAQYLSKKLNISQVCKDQVKEILFDSIGYETCNEKMKLNAVSNKLMLYFTQEQMRSGVNIILDYVFHESEKEMIDTLAKRYSYQIITVLFEGEIRTVYQRYIERDMSPKRHRGYIVSTKYPRVDKTIELYTPPVPMEEFIESLDSLGIRDFALGDTIVVDTTNYQSVNYQEIIRKIRNLMIAKEGDLIEICS